LYVKKKDAQYVVELMGSLKNMPGKTKKVGSYKDATGKTERSVRLGAFA
jgi:hypothetical protein